MCVFASSPIACQKSLDYCAYQKLLVRLTKESAFRKVNQLARMAALTRSRATYCRLPFLIKFIQIGTKIRVRWDLNMGIWRCAVGRSVNSPQVTGHLLSRLYPTKLCIDQRQHLHNPDLIKSVHPAYYYIPEDLVGSSDSRSHRVPNPSQS